MIRLDCNVSVAHYPLSRDYRRDHLATVTLVSLILVFHQYGRIKKYYCLLFNFNYHTETLIYSLILCTLMTGSRVHIPLFNTFLYFKYYNYYIQ